MIKRRRHISILLIWAMLLTMIACPRLSLAKSGPRLSKSTIHITKGEKRVVRITSPVAGKAFVTSLNPIFADVTKKSGRYSIKKGKPATVTIKGKSAGYAVFLISIKLKKKIRNKNEFERMLDVYIDEKPTSSPSAPATPTPSSAPTVTPSAWPTASATVRPTASATVRPTASPSVRPTTIPTAIPSQSPRPSTVPTSPPDPNNYIVTFSSGSTGNDVTGMPNPPIVKVPKSGSGQLTLPSAPHRTGYSFGGWIYKNDYIKNAGSVVTIDADMTIRARWERYQGPIVDYLPGDAGYENIRGLPPGKMLSGNELTVTDIIPSWSGHSFTGWCIQGYYDVLYKAGDTIRGISSNLNLVAQWDTPESSYKRPPNTPSSTTPPDEATVFERIIAMKSEYPEGMTWTNSNTYTWYAFGSGVTYHLAGCAAFAAIMSDAAFGKSAPAREILNPSASSIRVGDILRIANDSHSVIVLDTQGDYFTIAEGNINSSVHWGRQIPKSDPIDDVWTRWPA